MRIKKAVDAICIREPFFTTLVTSLKLVEDNEGCPTLGTDGENLYYNTKYVESLTAEELCGGVLHEVLHCAFLHQWRKDDREHMRWNVATDYAINTIVDEIFRIPKGGLLDSQYYGMSAEEIYDKLPKTKTIQIWCDKSKWGDGEGDKKGKGEGQGKKKKKQTAIAKAAMAGKWKGLFEQAISDHYGTMPENMQRVIAKTHYVPTVDWSALVASLLSEDTNDYTFSQPDRRFMEADFFLPGLQSVDRLKDVVFAYDTSGSIEEDDLLAYYQETLNLFANFSSLQGWIAVCDTQLHSFEEVIPQQEFDSIDFRGGGGTSFEPVFDEIARRGMVPKAVFYFSDTEGSFPHPAPEYPVFWLVRSHVGENYPLRVEFGEVIRFLAK